MQCSVFECTESAAAKIPAALEKSGLTVAKVPFDVADITKLSVTDSDQKVQIAVMPSAEFTSETAQSAMRVVIFIRKGLVAKLTGKHNLSLANRITRELSQNDDYQRWA